MDEDFGRILKFACNIASDTHDALAKYLMIALGTRLLGIFSFFVELTDRAIYASKSVYVEECSINSIIMLSDNFGGFSCNLLSDSKYNYNNNMMCKILGSFLCRENIRRELF